MKKILLCFAISVIIFLAGSVLLTKYAYSAFILVSPIRTISKLINYAKNTSDYSIRIRKAIADNTKRDWKNNEMVHKAIHRILDDYLFEIFDEINIEVNKDNIHIIDLMIDEIMKIAIVRY